MFRGKRIAVIGMARTGMATAQVLHAQGASVLLSDGADAEKLGARAAEAQSLGVETRFAATPEEALDGVDMVVPSPGVPRNAPVLRAAVERGLPVLSEIEIAYLLSRAPILATTGTNGKTTTTMLLGEMLRAGGRTTFVAGNIAADAVKMPLITAAAQADEKDVIVAEISSFQLEWVERFRPAIGILTNISPDHLDRYDSFAEYAGYKARLFAAQTAADVAVVNAGNTPSREIGESVRAQRLWFAEDDPMRENAAFVRGNRLVVRWQGNDFPLCTTEELRIPGAHNQENALAAAGAALAFGIAPDAVTDALTTFCGVVHRMEPVAEADGILYINNSMCTNVEAAVRSLEAMDRPVVVIAGGVGKRSEFDALGPVFVRKARHLVLIGRDADALEAAARAAGFTAMSRADSMVSAVAAARAAAQAGDAVMLSPACASFDMFADFEARGEAFRQAVRQMTEDTANRKVQEH